LKLGFRFCLAALPDWALIKPPPKTRMFRSHEPDHAHLNLKQQ
jgi:hypothetical protein